MSASTSLHNSFYPSSSLAKCPPLCDFRLEMEWFSTNLITLPPHSRRTDKRQAQDPLLTRVVDARQDQSVS